jgi:hypothetical protein
VNALNLQKFCARSYDKREHLKTAWAHKGWTYASNGHILLRVPAPEHADTVATHGAANAGSMVDDAGKVSYIGLPNTPEPTRCDECAGVGQYLQMKCPDCEGKGEFTHGVYDYECRRCEGDGLVRAAEGEAGGELQDCAACDGIGYFRGIGSLVGNATYDRAYLHMLAKLPGVRVCTNGPGKPMHFTFDGGEGLLMPFRDSEVVS